MKQLFILSIIIICSKFSFCQLNGIVKDSVTNVPIPYVNIWVENENIGTTSNEKGEFILPINSNSKVLVFSALGYKAEKYLSKSSTALVLLNPSVIELKEVVISDLTNEQVVEHVKQVLALNEADIMEYLTSTLDSQYKTDEEGDNNEVVETFFKTEEFKPFFRKMMDEGSECGDDCGEDCSDSECGCGK